MFTWACQLLLNYTGQWCKSSCAGMGGKSLALPGANWSQRLTWLRTCWGSWRRWVESLTQALGLCVQSHSWNIEAVPNLFEMKRGCCCLSQEACAQLLWAGSCLLSTFGIAFPILDFTRSKSWLCSWVVSSYWLIKSTLYPQALLVNVPLLMAA